MDENPYQPPQAYPTLRERRPHWLFKALQAILIVTIIVLIIEGVWSLFACLASVLP